MSKVAIVTGAGSNIGQRTVLALLGEGYSVTLGWTTTGSVRGYSQSSRGSEFANIDRAHRCNRSRLHQSLVR